MTPQPAEDWNAYRLLVTTSLERIEKKVDTGVREISAIHGDIKLLKFKASLWGAGAAAVVALILDTLKGIK